MQHFSRKIILHGAVILALSIGARPCEAQRQVHAQGFIQNLGQVVDQHYRPNPDVLFLQRSGGLTMQLRRQGVSYELFKDERVARPGPALASFSGFPSKPAAGLDEQVDRQVHRLDLDFIGASADVKVSTFAIGPTRFNYFTAGTPKEGITGVHEFGRVLYTGVWPGIDVEFLVDAKSGRPKYNFIVHPEGRLSDIRLRVRGTDDLDVTDDRITASTGLGAFSETIPLSYYTVEGLEHRAEVAYARSAPDVIGFKEVSRPPRNSTLVIDPIPDRIYGTYVGGTGSDDVMDVEYDSDGDLIVVGYTTTTGMATMGAFQVSITGSSDGFISKYADGGVDGSAPEWTTYFGSSEYDVIWAVESAAEGIAVAGSSFKASELSTFGQTVTAQADAYVALFDTDGDRDWCRYVLMDDQEIYYDVAPTSDGGIVAVGISRGMDDVRPIMSKFGPTGSLSWTQSPYEHTYMTGVETSDSRIYMTGVTYSESDDMVTVDDTPLCHMYDPPGPDDPYEVCTQHVLVQMRDNLGNLKWGVRLGGDSTETAPDIGLSPIVGPDEQREMFIVAGTRSDASWPEAPSGSPKNAFIAKITDPDMVVSHATDLITWIKYIGGDDWYVLDGLRIEVDQAGENAYVTGYTTYGAGLTTSNTWQGTYAGNGDALLMSFSTSDGTIGHTTYYGGSMDDQGYGISLDPDGPVCIGGYTQSSDLAQSGNAIDPGFGGGGHDGFFAVFDPDPPCTEVELVINTDGFGEQTSWEVIPAAGGAALYSGGDYADNTTIVEPLCLQDGCYRLLVYDSNGDGMCCTSGNGGYLLRTAAGKTIIDNAIDGTFTSTSAINNTNGNGNFCLPLGPLELASFHCDRDDLIKPTTIRVSEDPLVSAEYGVGAQNDDGYQIWVYDPDGTYSRFNFQYTSLANLPGPAGPTRTTYFQFTWQTLPPPCGIWLNIRFRSVVNGVYGSFGPACKVKFTCDYCTQLTDAPSSSEFSCGVVRANTSSFSNRLYCYTVATATNYQFRFEDVASPFTVITAAPVTGHWQALGSSTSGLLDGHTYKVTVQAKVGGVWRGYCGIPCEVTIDNTPLPLAPMQGISAEEELSFSVFPNPTEGSAFYLQVKSGTTDAPIDMDVRDALGRLVFADRFTALDGNVRSVRFDRAPASGMYTVTLRSGGSSRSERLMIE